MTGRNIGGIPGFDEAVEEVKEYMESGGDDRVPAEGMGTTGPGGRKDQMEMITIKFAKKLVGEPFTCKKGKELVEIVILGILNSLGEHELEWGIELVVTGKF